MSAAQNEFNELMRDKGRRTAHPEDEDEDDARSFLNLSDDDDDDDDRTPPASNADPDEDILPRASTSSARHTIPLTRYGANTGPKGVISDAQNFRDSRRQHRMSMRSNQTLPAQVPHALAGAHWHAGEKQLSDADEEDEDGEDDQDFMSRWRQSRLRELQNGGHESRMHQRARSGRFWGGLATVDGQGYLDALEKSGPDTVVAVYIYDDYVSRVSLGRLHVEADVLGVVPRERRHRGLHTKHSGQARQCSLRQAQLHGRGNGAGGCACIAGLSWRREIRRPRAFNTGDSR